MRISNSDLWANSAADALAAPAAIAAAAAIRSRRVIAKTLRARQIETGISILDSRVLFSIHPAGRISLPAISPRQLQLDRPGAERVVERVTHTDAGENQCHRQAAGTDPFRRQAVTVGSGDTPRAVARAGGRGVVMEDGGPGPPRLRRAEDTPIAGGIIGEGQQIALDPGVIDHIGTAAIPRICEHGAGAGDVGGPYGAPVLVQVLEKLPRGPVRDASLGNARDDESIIAFIRTGTVLRIGVDEIVA